MNPFDLVGMRIDVLDTSAAGCFWADLLAGSMVVDSRGDVTVEPPEASGYPLFFCATDTPKLGQNRIHVDLTTESQEAMSATLRRARELGARNADVGQSPDESHQVLADPEGNEFCLIEPDNEFLAGTGTIGAINCDGSRAVGHFWSTVLGWPLVWDHDEETAIQAPSGGTKITWSGPPLMSRTGRDRVRLVVSTTGDLEVAAAQLEGWGATRAHEPSTGPERTLLDPDGNEFHLQMRA